MTKPNNSSRPGIHVPPPFSAHKQAKPATATAPMQPVQPPALQAKALTTTTPRREPIGISKISTVPLKPVADHSAKIKIAPVRHAGLRTVQRAAAAAAAAAAPTYVPPYRRGGGGGGASGGGGGGYRMPLASARHDWLRDWLDQNAANLVVVRVRQQGTDDLVELRCASDPEGHNRIISYHIHDARSKRPYLGGTWMRGLYHVSLNAQENPIPGTLMGLWRTFRRNDVLFAAMDHFRGRAGHRDVSPAEQAMLAARRARTEDDD